MRKSVRWLVFALCPLCLLVLALDPLGCSHEALYLRAHRYSVTKDSPRVRELEIELVRVEPDGAVVIEQDGKRFSAGVGERFEGAGKMVTFLQVESSDPVRQSAVLGGMWCDRERRWSLW